MKKVLVTTDCFLPRWDGIARFLKELIPYLKKDFDITIACPRFPGRMPDLGIKIHSYPLLKIRFGDIFFSLPDKKEIEKLVKENDVVFNQTIGTIGALGIKKATLHDIPLVGYVHSVEWELAARAVKRLRGLVKAWVKLRAQKLYNKTDLLLVPSRQVDDELALHGIRAKRKIVPLGVNTSKFTPPLSKSAVKKALGLDPNKYVIGYVGRLGREKDLPTLINAFRRLKQKNVVLLIVGGGLKEFSFEHARIKFTGPVNNVVPYLQAMDVFVLPSLTETSSLATMEAMATGLPVIVTPVGSIPEYVKDGKNGIFFSRKDVSSLTHQLERLLNNEQLRARLGNEARKTMKERFTWPIIAKEIKFVLQELSR